MEMTLEQARLALQACLRQGAGLRGRPVPLASGAVLFQAQDSSDGLYVLERGAVRIYIRNSSADEIELARLIPGAVLGEMSLLGESTRSASCNAIADDTLLLFIDREQALRLIDDSPEARHALVVILSERARNMVHFIHDFSHLTALVANGDYNAVQVLINSNASQDPAERSAREAFRTMLERVRQREADLQSTIATMSLEIDHQRATAEVETIVRDSAFQALQQNSAELRRRLRGD
ncbi:MAG: cyclic nucleotide-binding domain-containing protein [Synechococcaceae cyanobacterium]|nr:cyclic nucleotide-binding domain-containing protein [Synechococcaceae cyanobacterium]